MGKIQSIKIETEHNFNLNQFIIPISHRNMKCLYRICLILSVIVNIYVVIYYDVKIIDG